MPIEDPRVDSFLKLADGLRELEVVIGEKARPVVAAVRACKDAARQAHLLRLAGEAAPVEQFRRDAGL